jgi:CDP-diglyceride synthetase
VDDVRDGPEDEVTRTDLPATRPEWTGPATGQVRITGAEPAGEVTGELPVVHRTEEPTGDEDDAGVQDAAEEQTGLFDDRTGQQPAVRLTDEPAGGGEDAHAVHPVGPGQTAVPAGTPTDQPHWTEPPTGQVPAVLARDSGDEGSGIEGPSWREEDADWVAHEELFDPAMFGDDEVALGSLDETDRTGADRRPWEFDLDRAGADPDGGDADPITEPVPVVAGGDAPAGREPAGDGRPTDTGAPTQVVAAVAGVAPRSPVVPSRDDVAAHLADPVDEGLPTGTERVGRVRRSGLLPGRLRAKQPEGTDEPLESPLAAEPPGASVTDVPGAGRRKRGLAGLAAADRTAEREGDQALAAAGDPVPDSSDPAPGTRRLRRSPVRESGAAVAGAGAAAASTSARVPAPGRAGPTGGGPPVHEGEGRPRPSTGSRAGSSIGLRVGTGVAAAVVALLAFKAGTVASLVLVVLVVTFAAGECFGVLRRAGYHPATLLGLVGTVSLTVGAYTKGVAALPLVLVLITVFTLIWYLFGVERGSPVAGTAATLLTVGWVSLLGAYGGLLLSPSTFPDRHGIAFLLGAIIATVANDVGALVVGGWLGRTPLAPSISPNKTWEGLLGGTVFTIVISAVAVGAIHPWSASNAALLGVVVSVVAPLGDLCESLLKRDLRLKDMGSLLPGHGGVLDRVDALLFVLPATYYLVRALNIA